MAKTKVSPIKPLVIARLELNAAVLLARLSTVVKNALKLPDVECHYWTDSTTVLAWLSSHPRKWPAYVANRTTEILDIASREKWRYVPTHENPADCATRGLHPEQLSSFNLWWHGPEFIKESLQHWPTHPNNLLQDVSINHQPSDHLQVHLSSTQPTVPTPNGIVDTIATLFSLQNSLSLITRILARCLRWKSIHQKQVTLSQFLTASELQRSHALIIKWSQFESFENEITTLKKGNPIMKTNTLAQLAPFLDKNEILRVGGRIHNSDLMYSTKHPAILHHKHPFTLRLVTQMHQKHLHPTITLLSALVRQNYWIIGARNLIRAVTRNCITCKRYRKQPFTQQMGNLPSCRFQASKAFQQTGVDYAGPFLIKSSAGRGFKTNKAYIALFVCLATKAMHLELVSSLSTDMFIAAFRRFVARRGLPTDVYSDNGSNFIGAKKQLTELYQLAQSQNHNQLISNFFSSQGTVWHFIPPFGPHFGGIWESGVKSVKHHLYRIIDDRLLTFEEMTTILCQIEGLLNSRPLVPIDVTDHESLDILTPGHFLVGEPIVSIPEPNLNDVKLSRLDRWQLMQNMVQGFWRRWSREYVTTLQQRFKWKVPQKNIAIGDLVLIMDDNTSPTIWPRGRVIDLHPGKDNLVRAVTLKTIKGQLKRPITKLCHLLSE